VARPMHRLKDLKTRKTDGRSPSYSYLPRFRNVFKQEMDFLRGYAWVAGGRGTFQIQI
jgi:hypothetical protein